MKFLIFTNIPTEQQWTLRSPGKVWVLIPGRAKNFSKFVLVFHLQLSLSMDFVLRTPKKSVMVHTINAGNLPIYLCNLPILRYHNLLKFTVSESPFYHTA